MPLIFVDCEAFGPCPSMGELTEFGAVNYDVYARYRDDVPQWEVFHGVIAVTEPDPLNPAVAKRPTGIRYDPVKVFASFAQWLQQFKGRSIMVSDNPAYDFQWINDVFWRHYGSNPFGHSARRISDFYAGLMGNFAKSQEWKRLRVTPHDHNPVHDAMGNVEAFYRMQQGER